MRKGRRHGLKPQASGRIIEGRGSVVLIHGEHTEDVLLASCDGGRRWEVTLPESLRHGTMRTFCDSPWDAIRWACDRLGIGMEGEQ